MKLVEVSPSDWYKWVSMKAWSGYEAIFLASGYDPHRSEVILPPSRISEPRELKSIMDMAWVLGRPPRGIPDGISLTEFQGKGLREIQISPGVFVAWAQREGFPVTKGVIEAIKSAPADDQIPQMKFDKRLTELAEDWAEHFEDRGVTLETAKTYISRKCSEGVIASVGNGRARRINEGSYLSHYKEVRDQYDREDLEEDARKMSM